ncbi:hypothetical protein DFS34DRAFT_424002 [Phlyctochytrium arcticum]|nr:hypothetical protein DFS34DRAFT_424002 [Phlyctochytrium arcticum]
MTSTKCMESMELRQASQSITGQRVGSGSQSLTNPSTRDHNYGSSKTRPSLNPNESRLPNTTVVSSSSLITPAAPKRAMYTPPHLRRKNAENDVSGTSPPSAASLSRSPPRGNNDASLSRSPPRGNNNASLSRSPPRGNNIASLSRSPPRGNNDASLSRSPPRGNDFRAQNQSNGNNHASRAGVKRDHSPPQQRRQPPEPVAPARRRPTAW